MLILLSCNGIVSAALTIETGSFHSSVSIGYSLNTNRVQIVQDMQRSVNDSSGMFASYADSSGHTDIDIQHRYRYIEYILRWRVTLPTI